MKKDYKNNSTQETFKHTDPNKKMEQVRKESQQQGFAKATPHQDKHSMSKNQCKGCSTTKPCECKNCCNKKPGMCK